MTTSEKLTTKKLYNLELENFAKTLEKNIDTLSQNPEIMAHALLILTGKAREDIKETKLSREVFRLNRKSSDPIDKKWILLTTRPIIFTPSISEVVEKVITLIKETPNLKNDESIRRLHLKTTTEANAHVNRYKKRFPLDIPSLQELLI